MNAASILLYWNANQSVSDDTSHFKPVITQSDKVLSAQFAI